MKNKILLYILITFALNISAQKKDVLSDSLKYKKVKTELKLIDSKYKVLSEKIIKIEDYNNHIIENYKLQNTTILYVSTILGLLFTVVIFYFGWRAQKVENEYERAKEDRTRIKKQFSNFTDKLDKKKKELKATEIEINGIKDDIISQKNNLSKLLEDFILNYTKEYIESNKEELFNPNDQVENNPNEEISNQINQLTEQIKLIEELQNDSTPEFEYKKIDIYFKSKKYSEVVKSIQELESQGDLKIEYFFYLALSLADLGKEPEAFNAYKKYLEHFPENAAALNNIGLLYKKKDTSKAIESFENAIENKSNIIYLRNLIKCYETNEEKISIYKKYESKFLELDNENINKKSFKSDYRSFIEENFMTDEILEFFKTEFDSENNLSNYLNLLEANIITREQGDFDELIATKDTYKLNSSKKIILNLLASIEMCCRNINCDLELNNIEIILKNEKSHKVGWSFNLIDYIMSGIKDSGTKFRISKIIEKLKSK